MNAAAHVPEHVGHAMSAPIAFWTPLPSGTVVSLVP
jgi:hypothetical protein